MLETTPKKQESTAECSIGSKKLCLTGDFIDTCDHLAVVGACLYLVESDPRPRAHDANLTSAAEWNALFSLLCFCAGQEHLPNQHQTPPEYGKRVGIITTVCTDNSCPVHDPRAAAQAVHPAPTIAPAPEAETDAEAEERQRNYEQQRKEYEEEQERRAEERRKEEEQSEQEYEAERARKEELQKARTAAFERFVQNIPATFTAAQLRVLLRALVNLDPYTFAGDPAEEIAGVNENEQRTAEEVLLSAIDGLEGNKLTGFALRLALTGHVAIPRVGEVDVLAEAEAAFAPSQPKSTANKKPKVKTPTPIKAASRPTPKKAAAKKKIAA